jgi:hypothetical protein
MSTIEVDVQHQDLNVNPPLITEDAGAVTSGGIDMVN